MRRIQELLKKKPVRMGLMGVTFITVLAVAQTALNWNEEAPVAKKVRRDLVESNVFDTGALEKVDTDMAQATYDQQKKELMNIKRDTQRMSEGQKKDLDKVLQKMTELQRQVADQNQVISVLTRNNQQINANINDPRITRARETGVTGENGGSGPVVQGPGAALTPQYQNVSRARGRETNGMIDRKSVV